MMVSAVLDEWIHMYIFFLYNCMSNLYWHCQYKSDKLVQRMVGDRGDTVHYNRGDYFG